MVIVVTLTALLNFYPGGYSLETSNNEVVIEKGMLKKEAHTFNITKDNELTIALVKDDIHFVKTLWYVSIISMTAILIGLATFLRIKNKIAFTITLVVFIILLMIVFASYMNSINNIESLILSLNK